MTTSTAKFKSRALIALFGVGSLVTTSAGPAAAQVQGDIVAENAGVGYEYLVTEPVTCVPPFFGETQGSVFEVTDTGTYDGVVPNALGVPTPVASFVGVTEVFIKTEQYVVSPEGSYSDCTLTDPIVEINNANVSTPAGQDGNVTCGELDGTYTRRAGDVIEITLTGSCTVEGNVLPGHVVDQQTTHVITGLQQPCSVPDLTDPEGGSIPPECLLFPEAGSYVTWDHVVLPA